MVHDLAELAHFQQKRPRGFVSENALNQSVRPPSDGKPGTSFPTSGLARAVGHFKAVGIGSKVIPRLWLFSDPVRLPDPEAVLPKLPPYSGLVYRHFGAADRLNIAKRLRAACRRHRLVFLIGADVALAHAVKAEGVHLPARAAASAGALKRRFPQWLITASAHDRAQLHRALGADAMFLSPVWPTQSSAGRTVLGLGRAAVVARLSPIPVIALGGVEPGDAYRLATVGFSGIAGVSWAPRRAESA